MGGVRKGGKARRGRDVGGAAQRLGATGHRRRWRPVAAAVVRQMQRRRKKERHHNVGGKETGKKEVKKEK
jgi:hypothetical protein